MLLVGAVFSTHVAAASPDGCSPREIRLGSLTASDPAYNSAMQLATILRNHGVVVQCVLRSKMAHFLPHQVGARLFRTDHGDFEALFRPEKRNFDDVHISGGPAKAGYAYLLKDAQGRLLRAMEGGPVFFLKDGNLLFISFQKQTAATLKTALQ
jgi:hypothetical protein